jgi:hypothetical protein
MLEIGLDYGVHRTIRGLTIFRIRRPFERSAAADDRIASEQ